MPPTKSIQTKQQTVVYSAQWIRTSKLTSLNSDANAEIIYVLLSATSHAALNGFSAIQLHSAAIGGLWFGPLENDARRVIINPPIHCKHPHLGIKNTFHFYPPSFKVRKLVCKMWSWLAVIQPSHFKKRCQKQLGVCLQLSKKHL